MSTHTSNRIAWLLSTALVLRFGISGAQRGEIDPEGLVFQSVRQTPAARDIFRVLSSGREQALLLAHEQKPPWNHFWSGYIRLRLGDINGSIRDLRQADEQGLGAESAKALAAAYYAARQYVLFRQKIHQAMDADPQDASPYYYLGRHYESDQRDTAKADECFREALRRDPRHMSSLYHLGYLAETRGEWESAAEYYRKSANVAALNNRRYGLPWLGMARVEQRTGSAEAAVRLARRGLELTPRDPEAQRVLAKTSAALGLHAEALKAWQQVAELDTTDPAPHYQLYRLHQKLGQTAQTRDELMRFNALRELYGDQ